MHRTSIWMELWDGLLGAGLQPGMVDKLVEADPLLWIRVQANSDQVLCFLGQLQLRVPYKLRIQDLLIRLVGYIAAEHVVKQDAQRPDCEPISFISSVLDPFRRAVYSASLKVRVDSLMNKCSGSKINEFNSMICQIN